MRFFIMCMAFLTLLCSVAQAEAPDIAFETDFEVVYQQLSMHSGWARRAKLSPRC